MEVGRGRDGGAGCICLAEPAKGDQSLVPTKTHPKGNSPYTEMEFSRLQ